MRTLRIGQVGHKWIGRAHTHAYTDLPVFFEVDARIEKSILCSNEESVFPVAERWGWTRAALDWREVVADPDVDIVVVAAPSAIHKAVSIEAAKNGKHVFCEKPLALTLEDAREMVKAVQDAGVTNMIGFNYRRVPALALARQMIQDGKLGEIRHFRGIYQQDWLVDPSFPLVWRLQKKDAGYGSHGDLGAHVIDTARFLVGDIAEIVCMQETFVHERPIATAMDGFSAETSGEMGQVDVDDASAMMFRFRDRNALGYIEVTRYGAGHRNQNRIEINGSKGSIIFDMEQMNELLYYDTEDPGTLQGYRRIQVGEASHPYTANWWPAGHIIGFGDTFVNEAYDFVNAVLAGEQITPDFVDGLKCQLVLDAADRSAKTGSWVKVEDA
jgi:predicted dehydrogenase